MTDETRRLLDSIRKGAETQEATVEGWSRESHGLDADQRYRAFEEMLEEDFWFWLPVICKMLTEEIGGPCFMPMIDQLSDRVDQKMAEEIFWSGLVDGGETRPRSALEHSKELIQEDRLVMAIFASALLAGSARTSPEDTLETVGTLWFTSRSAPRLAALKSMAIALNEKTLPEEELLDMILSRPIPEDNDLRSSYSMVLRLLHPLQRDAMESRLRELLRSSPPEIRDQVIHDISVLESISVDTRLLLEEYTGGPRS